MLGRVISPLGVFWRKNCHFSRFLTSSNFLAFFLNFGRIIDKIAIKIGYRGV